MVFVVAVLASLATSEPRRRATIGDPVNNLPLSISSESPTQSLLLELEMDSGKDDAGAQAPIAEFEVGEVLLGDELAATLGDAQWQVTLEEVGTDNTRSLVVSRENRDELAGFRLVLQEATQCLEEQTESPRPACMSEVRVTFEHLAGPAIGGALSLVAWVHWDGRERAPEEAFVRMEQVK